MPDELYDLLLRVRTEGINAVRDLKHDAEALDPALQKDARQIKNLDSQLRVFERTVRDLTKTLNALSKSNLVSGAFGPNQPGRRLADAAGVAATASSRLEGSFLTTTAGGSRVGKITSGPSTLEIDRAIANMRAVREINDRSKALEVEQRRHQAQVSLDFKRSFGVGSVSGGLEAALRSRLPALTLPEQLVSRVQLQNPTPKLEANQQRVLRELGVSFKNILDPIRETLKETNRRVGFEEVDARTRRTIAPGGRKISSIGPEVTRAPLGERAIGLGDKQANLARVLNFVNASAKDSEKAANAIRIIEESLRDVSFGRSGEDRYTSAAAKIASRLRAIQARRADPFKEQQIQTELLPRAHETLRTALASPVELRSGETFENLRASVKFLNPQIENVIRDLKNTAVEPELRGRLEQVLQQRYAAFKRISQENEVKVAQARAKAEQEALKQAISSPLAGLRGGVAAAGRSPAVQKQLEEFKSRLGLGPFVKGELGSVDVTRLGQLANQLAGKAAGGVRSVVRGLGFDRPSVSERLATGDIFSKTSDPESLKRQEALQQQIERSLASIDKVRATYHQKEIERQDALVAKVAQIESRKETLATESAQRVARLDERIQKNSERRVQEEASFAARRAEAFEKANLRISASDERVVRAKIAADRARAEAEKVTSRSGLSSAEAKREADRLQRRIDLTQKNLQQAKALQAFERASTQEEVAAARAQAPVALPPRRGAFIQLGSEIEKIEKAEEASKSKLDALEKDFSNRKVAEQAKASAKILAEEKKLEAARIASQDKISRSRAALLQKEVLQEQKVFQLKKNFLLQEEVIRKRGESRFGGEFAFAATALLGYLSALKAVGIETVKYAARTETLRIVTNQMAETNHLNVDTVEEYARVVQRLNITTQEANLLIQKMIFAQLDVAKATDLARVAQDAAVIANINSSEALERVIRGITTGQSRILFNLGIQVSLQETILELRRKFRAEGIDREPSVIERRQAQLNRVLFEGAKLAGSYERALLTAGKQLTSLQREFEEAQNAIGSEFLPEFGKLIGYTRDSLRFAQENGKAFAFFASTIAGLGSALAVLASSKFFTFIVGGAAAHPLVRIAAIVAAIGTIAALNQDDYAALNETAENAIAANEKKLEEAQERLVRAKQQLLSASNNEERKSAEENLRLVELEVERRGATRVAIEDDVVRQKAELYLRDVENFKNAQELKKAYIESRATGVKSTAETLVGAAAALQDPSALLDFGLLGRIRQTIGFGPGPRPPDEETAKRAEEIRKNQESALLRGEVIDKERAYANTILQEAQLVGTKIGEIAEKLNEGAQSISQLSFFGGAAEKIRFDRKEIVREITGFFDEVNKARELAAKGQPENLNRIALAVGQTTDLAKGLEALADYEERLRNLSSSLDERVSLQAGRLARETRIANIPLRERIELAKLGASIIEGSFAEERRRIEETRRIQLRFNEEFAKAANSSVEAARKRAEIEAQYAEELINLGARIKKSHQDANEALTQGFLKIQNARKAEISEGRTRAQIIDDFYVAELERIAELQSKGEQRSQIRDLELDTFNKKAEAAAKKRQEEIEVEIALLKARREISEKRDRAFSDLAPASRREIRDVREVDRTAQERLRILEEELRKKGEIEDADAIHHQLTIGRIEIQKQRELDRIEAAKNGIESLNRARIEQFDVEFRRLSRIADLSVTTPAEEAAAALKLHNLKLELIEREFEIRGKGEDAMLDKIKKTGEANFEFLGNLLEIRKREIESVRNAAESVFDALTTRGREGLRELVASQARVVGRQIFGNLAVEFFKNARESLGSVIPGQRDPETKEPTILGRLLGGTIFSPSQTQDIQQQLVDVNRDSILVEKTLTIALDRLRDTISRSGLNTAFPGDELKLKDPESILYFTEQVINSATRVAGGFGSNQLALRDPSKIIEVVGRPIAQEVAKASTPLSSSFSAISSTAVEAASQAEKVTTTLGDTAARIRSVSTSLGFSIPGIAEISKGTTAAANIAGSAALTGRAGSLFSGFPFNQQVPSSRFGRFSLGFGAGAFGRPGNVFKAITGEDFSIQLAPGVATTASSQGLTTKGARVGQIAGAAATAGFGVQTAISGFKEGGARGNLQGISGVLTAASTIPGPQQPYIQAAALITGFIGSLFGSSKETFEKKLDEFLESTEFEPPDPINKIQDIRAGDIDFNIRDQARPIQQTFNLNIQAIDSKSILDRSHDIAAAIHKEFSLNNTTLTNDVNVALFNS